MLDSKGFDLWSGDYDKTVNVTDINNNYPFAGYKDLLNSIYRTIMNKRPATILDIGIGTGTLALKLYEGGNSITGIDFSKDMLEKTKSKMPEAILFECDFSKGLPPELQDRKYDFIISTYAFHHLSDKEKISFIFKLIDYLNDNGVILIGDVAFQNRADLEACKSSYGSEWDDDEHYIVFSELSETLRSKYSLEYNQVSLCAGLLTITPLVAV